MKATRLEKCNKVLNYMKSHPATVKIFSDKKIFTMVQVLSRRDDRCIAGSSEEVQGTFRTKHPAQTMCMGVVASGGKKMNPFFFKPNEKIGTEAYYKVLRWKILPWLKANYHKNKYVWTQDGAPSHTATKNRNFCKEHFADFWDKTF